MHRPTSAATHVEWTQRRPCRSDRGTGPRASRKVGVVGQLLGGCLDHPSPRTSDSAREIDHEVDAGRHTRGTETVGGRRSERDEYTIELKD